MVNVKKAQEKLSARNYVPLLLSTTSVMSQRQHLKAPLTEKFSSLLDCSQVVRQRFLISLCIGSSPVNPEKFST